MAVLVGSVFRVIYFFKGQLRCPKINFYLGPLKGRGKGIVITFICLFVCVCQCTLLYNDTLNRVIFIALIHPIQWTIALPVGVTGPAKCQKKTSCI